MLAAAEKADVALEFESLAQEDGRDMGTIARRSSSTWNLRTSAKSGHSWACSRKTPDSARSTS